MTCSTLKTARRNESGNENNVSAVIGGNFHDATLKSRLFIYVREWLQVLQVLTWFSGVSFQMANDTDSA